MSPAEHGRIRRYSAVLTLLWTCAAAASLTWNLRHGWLQSLELARAEARASLNKDLVYLRWASLKGGVYVPLSESTPSNPYLELPERDITTPSGRALTLVPPPYLIRQIYEFAHEEYGTIAHITSLDPVRPANAPDVWEAEALRAFERGATEVSAIEEVGGQPNVRLMLPLVTEASCLRCHDDYVEGRVRGGTSISIPLAFYVAQESGHVVDLAAGHGLLWALGLAGLAFGARRLAADARERLRNTEALTQAKERAETASRVMTDFLAVASHELRTPLTTLRLIVDQCRQLEQRGQPIDTTRTLKRLDRATARLSRMVTDLLDLSRLEHGGLPLQKQPFDLGKLTSEVVADFRDQAPLRSITLKLPPGPVTLVGDPVRLGQVLGNLLDNAIKYTPEATPIEVELEVPEGAARVSVTDHGPGVPAERRPQLFTRFYGVGGPGPRVSGMGIGLYLCRVIVSLHGGHIEADTEEGRGSRFWFTLPLLEAPPP
ncbi:MAG: sensor histidine kinase [Myxococcaceae bacterium]